MSRGGLAEPWPTARMPPKPSRLSCRSFQTLTVSARPFASSCAFSARMAGVNMLPGRLPMARMVLTVVAMFSASLHRKPCAGHLVFPSPATCSRERTPRVFLVGVLAEALEFVAGEKRAFHRGGRRARENRRDRARFRRLPSLSRCLTPAPAARRSVSVLDLVLLAEADDERALVPVAQQNDAERRAVEFLRRNAGGQREPLTKKVIRSALP